MNIYQDASFIQMMIHFYSAVAPTTSERGSPHPTVSDSSLYPVVYITIRLLLYH